MACPICFFSTFLGGAIGSYWFGINPPSHTKGKILSTSITTSLVLITNIALKALFNFSFCVSGGSTLSNILRVGSATLILGNIYSIGVNYLLGRYIFLSPAKQKKEPVQEKVEQKPEETPSCCCKNPVVVDENRVVMQK